MQSFNIYNIDFNRLAAWLTPRALRKPKFVTLIRACVFPIVFNHNSFLRYRKAKIYQLTITPQVCYLQRMLNDKYDYSQRRIRIQDAEWHLPLFLYQEEELKPQMIFQESENNSKYLFNDAESGEAKTDFVVLVPTDISFAEAEMRGMIDSYYLFGTTYTIQKV
jgi:hypothetical protein